VILVAFVVSVVAEVAKATLLVFVQVIAPDVKLIVQSPFIAGMEVTGLVAPVGPPPLETSRPVRLKDGMVTLPLELPGKIVFGSGLPEPKEEVRSAM